MNAPSYVDSIGMDRRLELVAEARRNPRGRELKEGQNDLAETVGSSKCGHGEIEVTLRNLTVSTLVNREAPARSNSNGSCLGVRPDEHRHGSASPVQDPVNWCNNLPGSMGGQRVKSPRQSPNRLYAHRSWSAR